MGVHEENFIEELKNKNSKAIDYVIESFGPLVKGIVTQVLYKLKDSGAVDECMSDVFMAVWQNSSKFQGENKDFKKWIACVAKFKAIDYYRKLTKTPFTEAIEDVVVKNPINTEEDFLSIENEKQLKTLIENLEETNKKIFIMKFFLGLSSDKIGEKLNLTRTAVDNRILRERKKLKDKFYEIQGEGI